MESKNYRGSTVVELLGVLLILSTLLTKGPDIIRICHEIISAGAFPIKESTYVEIKK